MSAIGFETFVDKSTRAAEDVTKATLTAFEVYPKPNPWLAQEEYSITHFNSAQTDAFSSAVKGVCRYRENSTKTTG